MKSAHSKYALHWDLPFYPPAQSPEFARVLEEYEARLTRLASRFETLPALSHAVLAAWSECLREFEAVEALAGDLASYVGCRAADDAGNAGLRQLEARLSALDPLRERVSTHLDFALRDLADDQLDRMVRADQWLTANRFFIDQRRKNARMRLPKREELLAAELAVDGLHAWGRLYDRLSGELRVTVMERGELVQKSPGQIRFDSPERGVRQNNFHASAKAWHGIADSCADALNHIAGTRLTIYHRLGLTDHLEMPLHRNRMQRGTLNAMWSAVERHSACLVKYLGAKARLLGLERPCWYDTQAPLPQAVLQGGVRIGFDDGLDLVISSFENFSADLGEFARHAARNRWIEAEDRPGKRQGAFCTGFPAQRETRVFMTYTNTFDNVSTLAHELGHAYHSWVLRDEPLFLQDYPMNLAETASTFAETVLAEERLAGARSDVERLAILDHMCADAVAFLMNIRARFLFEDRFHQERARGELAAERLSELMLAAQQEAYVEALADDGWYPEFWVSKLHFYISGLPFYNFPYTFGYLLSTGLFAVARENRPKFPEEFRRLLLATGCMETEAAVQSTMGFDLRQAAFWDLACGVVERRVEQFLDLADRVSGPARF
jgi:pepF/M3 family oligoendopeptidase